MLHQRKLTAEEWKTTEISIDKKEKELLQFLETCYCTQNVDQKWNKTPSLMTKLKIDPTPEMELYLYDEYFSRPQLAVWKMDALLFLHAHESTKHQSEDKKESIMNSIFEEVSCAAMKSVKKADLIRLANTKREIEQDGRLCCFEQDMVELMMGFLQTAQKKKHTQHSAEFYLYTLHAISQSTIMHVNKHVSGLINRFLMFCTSLYKDQWSRVVLKANEFLENNDILWKNLDIQLFSHQKDLFRMCRNPEYDYNLLKYKMEGATKSKECASEEEGIAETATVEESNKRNNKLIFFVAPTATGKTLTPITLCSQYRILFVCAARHVGLALARSAISMDKKIAFAFGCQTASDIRLHYAAAVEYTKDRRSGGIGKVDNTVGEKVEIMICDLQSYLCAMYYMLAFNPLENILTYWDEPTISMDYDTHPLHETLKKNWHENLIPNMILSSATLPDMGRLEPMMRSFHRRFNNTEFITIASNDIRKSIPVINDSGFVEMIHYLSDQYCEILVMVLHCQQNPTLMRYFDLDKCVEFMKTVEETESSPESFFMDSWCTGLETVNMAALKIRYLELLAHITPEKWPALHAELKANRTGYFVADCPVRERKQQGVLITTRDSHTLTDGPTLFLAEDVDKLGQFYLSQAQIPNEISSDLLDRIAHNNDIRLVMDGIEKEIENVMGTSSSSSSSSSTTAGGSGGTKEDRKSGSKKKMVDEEKETRGNLILLRGNMELLQSKMKRVQLNEHYVPNKAAHLKIHASNKRGDSKDMGKPFTSSMDEQTVIEIMSLGDSVEDKWKLLLLMGVGVFGLQVETAMNAKYTEIMKRLAEEQKLYLIIATGDYIYGTNYQFCHGYLGKDLNLTQQKLIQAMGRIGRNNIQQRYSIRFRHEAHPKLLFFPQERNIEADKMNELFGWECFFSA